jgi:hypothetical protein
VSIICEDASALAPAGARRLVFAHHAQQLRASATAAAQARVQQTLGELGAGGNMPLPLPAMCPLPGEDVTATKVAAAEASAALGALGLAV